MQLKKALLKVISVLVFVLVLFPVVANAEELQPGQCEMTIESDKHTPQSPAQATGPCNGLVEGYYVAGQDRFGIAGMVTATVTSNGQKFTIGTPKHPYGESILTVYIVKKNPPKQEEPKDEKPKEEPKDDKPKQEQPTQPPKQDKPKQDKPKQETPKQENTKPSQDSTSKPSNQTNTNKNQTQTQTQNNSKDKNTNNETPMDETDLEEDADEEVEEENEENPAVEQVDLTNFEPIIDDYIKIEEKESEDVKSTEQDNNDEEPVNDVSTDNGNSPKVILSFIVGIALISVVGYGVYKRKG